MSIIRIVAGFLLAVASLTAAHAECAGGSAINHTNGPTFWNPQIGLWCSANPNNSGGWDVITNTPVLFRNGEPLTVPPGYIALPCDDRQRLPGDALQAVAAAGVTALMLNGAPSSIRDRTAIIAGLVAAASAHSRRCYVIVKRDDFRDGSIPRERETVRRPAICEVGGEDFGDISEAACMKIRRALTRTYPEQTAAASQQAARPNCEFAADRSKKKWFATEAECKAWDGT